MGKSRDGFAELLLKQKVLSREQLEEARNYQQKTGCRLDEAVVKMNYASQAEVTKALADEHGLEFIELDEEIIIPASVIEQVPESVARENDVLPLAAENGTLMVIMSDPTNTDAIDKLKFILDKEIVPVLATREQIKEAINRHYGQTDQESVDSMIQEFTDTAIDFTETESSSSQMGAEEDAPVIKLMNLMIMEAVNLKASDIHVEPFVDRVRVRYRVDGVLVERDSPPKRLHPPMLARIKVMAGIDIAEKRRPQDGRIKYVLGGKQYDLRVSCLPTVHGQAVVMRILDRGNITIGIRDLGFADDDYGRFQQIIKRPNGIFLVTGPTGSGKTTTLYAALNELNRPDRKIITAEDPVEYYLPGINQVEVKHNIGLDFARIIRAMLRQAPNIILVGEIRDRETAEIAVQASLTGHLVFSTLHTNDAPSAVTRLADIGIPPFLIASSVIAILAQRLVRNVCSRCKEPYRPTSVELRAANLTPEMIQNATFQHGKGCNNCHGSGYRGRIGIFELLRMNTEVRDMTFNREPAQTIRSKIRQLGMRSMLQDGVGKAVAGRTTLSEVLEACHHGD
ncbi:MAG: Flp pilus assembly complex ATPase component TadA [Planctomycetia bacterium]|nr:Flp pilus assembly complex ATPase component TadA [Planctomycetia bacterium]